MMLEAENSPSTGFCEAAIKEARQSTTPAGPKLLKKKGPRDKSIELTLNAVEA
jgi:hypothetical protein